MYVFRPQLLALVFVMILVQCTVVQQCPDKDSFVQSFDDTISTMGAKNHELSDRDWAAIDDDVKDLLDVCYIKYKEELSLTDKIDVIKNLMIYEVHRDLDDLNLQSFDLHSEFEELGENGAREIERFVKDELGQTLENTIDEVLENVSDLGEELKRWLSE